jgi:hypothetical protein
MDYLLAESCAAVLPYRDLHCVAVADCRVGVPSSAYVRLDDPVAAVVSARYFDIETMLDVPPGLVVIRPKSYSHLVV